ncbi:ATP-dependent helicase [Halobacillus sp. A1]|uniref:UvrD-helicase domain-containing protein n=1 Tax=Halobacillus sp. A1 TaxID=2880262 RepID=UPI0020A64F41|nr:ATP-dependent helicase [Halobacillus sp. A1]MCP3032586.1 ATP-dependent helicase [Halobacillus sp. A1]
MDKKSVILSSSEEPIEIDEHFKLRAGPGAGKTRFLVNHIYRILNYSERLNKSRKIACITYTNNGAETIVSRLKEVSENVEVSTIHSFLYKHIVKPYLWVLEGSEFSSEKLNGHEEIKPGYTLLNEYKQKSKQQWIKDNLALASALSKLRWGINEEGDIELNFLKPYHGKVENRNIRKSSYMIYKEICWNNGLMSHDDVLYFSYKILLQNVSAREIIRAKFPYLLMDEFQDTNPVQVEVAKLIGKKETVVGAIGDPAQSIFSFQGADYGTFNRFILDDMSSYVLENNHRSTDQIIKILNHVRNEINFVQRSPDNKVGDHPVIIVGDPFTALEMFKKKFGSEEWAVLGFQNNVTNSIKHGFTNFVSEDFDLFYKDNQRGRRIYHIINALEYGYQMQLKEAIKFMKKAFSKVDNYSDKDALFDLKNFLNKYDDFYTITLKEFYNRYIFNTHGVKQKITSGNISEFYEGITYDKFAATISISDDRSQFKTIHKAKGEEYNNVFIVIPDNNEEKGIEFLLDPDMNKEKNRVYYVALSRAKENLYINVSSLSQEKINLLKHLGFDIRVL